MTKRRCIWQHDFFHARYQIFSHEEGPCWYCQKPTRFMNELYVPQVECWAPSWRSYWLQRWEVVTIKTGAYVYYCYSNECNTKWYKPHDDLMVESAVYNKFEEPETVDLTMCSGELPTEVLKIIVNLINTLK